MADPTNRTRRPHALLDADLGAALLDLSAALAIPDATAGRGVVDPALRARLRIERGDVPRRAAVGWRRWVLPGPIPGSRLGRPLGRSLVLGLVAVVVVAAIAGAIGLGLPGIRIVAGPSPSAVATIGGPGPSATGSAPRPTPPSPTATIAGPLGSGLGLGDRIAVADAAAAVDIAVIVPRVEDVGPPATAWLLDGRLSFVWPAGPGLPPTAAPGIGLLLSEFRGSLDAGYFEKIVDSGTTLTTISVDGVTGYWISGASHEIVFIDAQGQPVFDSRRSVADTLLWARDGVTYRLESGLGRAATLAIADAMR